MLDLYSFKMLAKTTARETAFLPEKHGKHAPDLNGAILRIHISLVS
jgi:hypothetical protein